MFSNSNVSKIKCAVGLSMHGNKIKLIDKRNDHADCPLCSENVSWEYMALCGKKKEKIRMVEKVKNRM